MPVSSLRHFKNMKRRLKSLMTGEICCFLSYSSAQPICGIDLNTHFLPHTANRSCNNESIGNEVLSRNEMLCVINVVISHTKDTPKWKCLHREQVNVYNTASLVLCVFIPTVSITKCSSNVTMYLQFSLFFIERNSFLQIIRPLFGVINYRLAALTLTWSL